MFNPLPRLRIPSFLTPFRTFPLRAHALTLIGLLTWLPILSAFHSYVATLMFVTGPSMYPLLNTDYYRTTRKDVVLVDMRDPSGGLKRGMVVSFWSPQSPDTMAIKRVVALPGDIVETKKPYPFREETVPAGHVWVEGEHPESDRWSSDSNFYGPISKSLLTGKVRGVVWPFSRAGRLGWQDYRGTSRVKVGTVPELENI